MKVKGSTVLITGANRGIGKGFVEEFLKAGAKKIYLGVRRTETITNYASRAPQQLIPLQLDVTNQDDIDEATKMARDITILINNAGVLYGGDLLDKNRMEEARHEMDVNYFGPLAMIHSFAPILQTNGGGVIVNMSSIAGLVALPGMPTYSTSKAAVHFLTLEARMELAPRGIHVIGLYPGPVDTDMTRSLALPKVTPGHVATETIRAIEKREDSVFPDPCLKDIYAVLHAGRDHAVRKVSAVLESKARAA